MSKSLRLKLILIMLLLILLLMSVVGVFLIRGVQNFYTDSFYDQMRTVFSDENMASALRESADEPDAVKRLESIVEAYSGLLGIDAGSRNYYILDGTTGKCLATSAFDDGGSLDMTPNILTALAGSEGSEGSPNSRYMDVAVPVSGDDGSYIIYIRDNKHTVQTLNSELLKIILEALAIGIVVSAALSIILSRTMLQPIRSMTKAAEKMAGGDFSAKIDVQSDDEIGILSDTFNDMAGRLEQNLEDLRMSEQMRREFVANVSHELRTPITSIKSYAETLAENDDIPPEMRKDFLRVIQNESTRMTKIVQDLLELSRFDSGHTKFEFERFNLEQSVRDVCAALAPSAKEHGHTINLELEWQLPEIIGDSSRIEQVLMNLISNAIKYTPDGGTIDVSSGHSGDEVWVKVQDSGVGIPKEDLDRVFDRFYRVDKARSRESGGTGLGLSIAQEIVSRHGGRIELESEPGKGTTATVILKIEGPENG